jgi:hypothetical protein
MRALVGLLMLTIVACGGGRRADPPPSPPSNSSSRPVECTSAAATITRILAADVKQSDTASVQTNVEKRCTDDHWTAEARSCLAAASTEPALTKCGYNHFTQAQQDRLDDATAGLGTASIQYAMKMMEQFRDDMCACKDAACAQQVSEVMTEWSLRMSREQRKPPKMTEESVKRATEIGETMGKCMQAAMGASQPPTPKLRVTGLTPESGETGGGTKVTFAGSGFTTESRTAKVYFGDKPAKNVKISSDTELVADAPAGKANQTVDVLLVFDPGGEMKIVGAYTYGKKK